MTDQHSAPDFDDDEVTEGCGYTYDHSLGAVTTEDGVSVAVCRECGAGLMWDEEDEL